MPRSWKKVRGQRKCRWRMTVSRITGESEERKTKIQVDACIGEVESASPESWRGTVQVTGNIIGLLILILEFFFMSLRIIWKIVKNIREELITSVQVAISMHKGAFLICSIVCSSVWLRSPHPTTPTPAPSHKLDDQFLFKHAAHFASSLI